MDLPHEQSFHGKGPWIATIAILAIVAIVGVLLEWTALLGGGIFETEGFVARLYGCGVWTPWHAGLHIVADLLIGSAYIAIPLVLSIWWLKRRRQIPYPYMLVCFAAFILSCGIGHFVDAFIFFNPVYRFFTLVKLVTAVSSWSTAIILIPITPVLLQLKTPLEYEQEVQQRVRQIELEKQRRTLFEDVVLNNTAVSMFLLDEEGKVTYASPMAMAMTGFLHEELIGSSLHDLIHHTRIDGTPCPAGECLVNKVASNINLHEDNFVRKNGQFFPAICTMTSIPGGAVLTIRDVSELKDAHQKAHNETYRNTQILNAIKDYIIFDMDLSGKVGPVWNTGAQHLTGWSDSESLGKHLSFWYPPEVREEADLHIDEAARNGSYSSGVCWRMRKDGTRFQVRSSLFAIRDLQGRVSGFVKIAADVTSQQRYESELIAARNYAEEANRAKDQFLAVVSHELRTPLTPIMAVVSAMLQRDDLESDMHDMLAMIADNVNIELRLINDLLDAMRIVTGKLPYKFEVVDLHDVLQESIDTCCTPEEQNAFRLTTNYGAATVLMHGDRARLKQVFWNIIKNSVKFMPNGGDLKIRTKNERRGDRLCIDVSFEDTGIGIHKDRIASIFDIFVQGEGNFIRQYGGLGLGLAICKSIVEAHGGTIVAASAGPGKGAEFVVELPTMTEAMDMQAATVATNGNTPLRIFYVEDDRTTATTYKRLFEDLCGFLVTHVPDVKTAMEKAGPDYDIVLSDIGLPDGDGWTVMRHFQKHWPTIPGVAFSGFGSPDDIARSNAAGFNQHIVKPAVFPDLVAVIRSLASNSKRLNS